MATDSVVYAKDYKAPDFTIEKTQLRFELSDDKTRVTSKLSLLPVGTSNTLRLDGVKLELISIKIDGRLIEREEFTVDDESLTIHSTPNEGFELECVTDIDPEQNLAFEGLYRSRGMYCTQCEAEGFRRITYYLDRPDVLSEFETTIIAPDGKFNRMLSNGNCVRDEVIEGNRHVSWHDPFKKPCYLFALVAGNLDVVEDSFTTCSGRDVKLEIFVEAKDLDKCDHAMRSLKASMKWDEDVYGREYDLDIFMIVAVDDFNMGAMENKGLNIFNTSCVLANEKTTTDAGFQRVEGVVAHEYFHNWSGNRVTCRDWFQLSLKEGFTVYRDSEFSADMNDRAVKRIEDAALMRNNQFVEDSGPMSHPVRPDSYEEISNFYTLTVYEKGAEVVRMQADLLGKETFRKATDRYFEKFDGQAVTCEDFVATMEEVSGQDLSQYRLWYSQAGTPELHVTDSYDANKQTYQLTIEQRLPESAAKTSTDPMLIPINFSVLTEEGVLALSDQAIQSPYKLTQQKETLIFTEVKSKPVPVLNRAFAAPIKVFFDYSPEQLARIVKQETDGYSQFDAMQSLYIKQILTDEASVQTVLFDALEGVLSRKDVTPALLAKLLNLPTVNYLVELDDEANPLALYEKRQALFSKIAQQFKTAFETRVNQLSLAAQDLSQAAISARSLKNVLLQYLSVTSATQLVERQFNEANNMTDEFGALQALVHFGDDKALSKQALNSFFEKWKDEALVVNMWLQVQSTRPSEDALAEIKALLDHPAYQATNPNKIRALIAGFAANVPAFHQVSGEGYAFLADQVLAIDKQNPQIASRIVAPLTGFKRYAPEVASKMKEHVQRLSEATLSKDLAEVVHKSLDN